MDSHDEKLVFNNSLFYYSLDKRSLNIVKLNFVP